MDKIFKKYVNKKFPEDIQKYFRHLSSSDHSKYTPYYQDRNSINHRTSIPLDILESNGHANLAFLKKSDIYFKNGLNILISLQYYSDNKSSPDEFNKYLIDNFNGKDNVSVRVHVTKNEDKNRLDEFIESEKWKRLEYIPGIFNGNGSLTKDAKGKYGIKKKFQGNQICDGHYILDISTGYHKDTDKHNTTNEYMFCPYVDYCNEKLIEYRKFKIFYIFLHFEDILEYVINEEELIEDRQIIGNYLKSIEFNNTNLYDNTLFYELSNGKQINLIENGIAKCPLLNKPLRCDRFRENNNHIQYCHNKAVCKKLLTIDEKQNCVNTANSPTNFFMGYQTGNSTQGDMTLEEYYIDLSERTMNLGLSVSNTIHQEAKEEIESLKNEIESLKNENKILKEGLTLNKL